MERGVSWQPIETAPKDGTLILGWCKHEADPYFDGEHLTAYGTTVEKLGHVINGPHVIQWGAGYVKEDFYGRHIHVPGCWFRYASNFAEPANPIAWAVITVYDVIQED